MKSFLAPQQDFFSTPITPLKETSDTPSNERFISALKSHRNIIVYLCVLSILYWLVLLGTKGVRKIVRSRTEDEEENGFYKPVSPRMDNGSSTFLGSLKEHVEKLGGAPIFFWNILRFLCILVVIVITVINAINDEEHSRTVVINSSASSLASTSPVFTPGFGKWGKKKQRKWREHESREAFGREEFVEMLQAGAFVYFGVLSLFTLTASKFAPRLKAHLSPLLFITTSYYIYRYAWPQFLYTTTPTPVSAYDISRVALLCVAGILVPLFVPRTHKPLVEGAKPTQEQTASLYSLLFYEYLTPLVYAASKKEIDIEDLPSLAEEDESLFLAQQNLHKVDPIARENAGFKNARQRNIFWGLVEVFKWDWLGMVMMLLVKTVVDFARPIAINRVLASLERKSKNETPAEGSIRPIFWIVMLFAGPVGASLVWNFYIYISTRLLVRCESILSQLIFKHTLRIRMNGSRGSHKSLVDTGTNIPNELNQDLDAPVVMNSPASIGVVIDDTDSGEVDTQVGRINNLIGTDMDVIVEARDFMVPFVFGITQIVLAVVFLYQLLSWSAFIGVGIMALTFPCVTFLIQAVNDVQENLSAASDARINAVTEAMSSIRMVKMFAWEAKLGKKIAEFRDKELHFLKLKKYLSVANGMVNYLLPVVTMVFSLGSYTFIQKQELSAAKVYSAQIVFDLIRMVMHLSFLEITRSISGKVSLDRISKFLGESELLDEFDPHMSETLNPSPEGFVGFKNATFSFTNSSTGRNFRLNNLSVDFVKGGINVISGATGSGKSAMLSALLGELHFEPQTAESIYNLPRKDGVALVPAEAWLMNATIKDNITLAGPVQEQRFSEVLRLCALDRDLSLLKGGAHTEVGEKGVTLSGGQKARISLARAVYSGAQTLLIDDVLSALDIHTARHIAETCFTSKILQNRTIIIATHHVSLVGPIASLIVQLGKGGTIASQFRPNRLESNSPPKFTLEVDEEEITEMEILSETVVQEDKPDKIKADALVQDEERASGGVSLKGLAMYFGRMGWYYVTLYGIFMVIQQSLYSAAAFWLGHWAKQYESVDRADEVSVPFYLASYAGIVASSVTVCTIGYVFWISGAIQASRSLHTDLVTKILKSTMRWIDSTPVGRIIARFSKDMRAIDDSFVELLGEFTEINVVLVLNFLVIVWIIPSFLVAGIAIGIAGVVLGNYYLKAQLPIKRLMTNSKSPVFSHLNGAISGIVSIRAFGVHEWMAKETRSRIDRYSVTGITYYNLNRWVTTRIDVVGALFTASLAAFLLYGTYEIDASVVGFALSLGVAFSSHILWWVQVGNHVQVESNSIERVSDYLIIDEERQDTQQGAPPAAWPTSGSVQVEHLVARYTEGGTPILKDLTFSINSGERVAVVGRTGAGKSSMALALLQMIPTEGKILVDGMDLRKMNLSSLRSQITIIPQDPVLMFGSLRYNLDPFGERDDAALNDALRASGFTKLQEGLNAGDYSISLDTMIAAGGSNLSQGQRQILVLARAIVRRSKFIVMDEATANIDHDIDEAIQVSMRKEMKGQTVITIAHRLRTLMDYDKIIVLGEGKLLEFDSPYNLMRSQNHFSELVRASGEEEQLIKLIQHPRTASD